MKHSVYVGESHCSLPYRMSRHQAEYWVMLGKRSRGGEKVGGEKEGE